MTLARGVMFSILDYCIAIAVLLFLCALDHLLGGESSYSDRVYPSSVLDVQCGDNLPKHAVFGNFATCRRHVQKLMIFE